MEPPIKISEFKLLFCVLDCIKLTFPALVRHMIEVGYVAGRFANAVSLSSQEKATLITAGLLHDIGVVNDSDHFESFLYEGSSVQFHLHLGYRMVEAFPPFHTAARLIQFHHYLPKVNFDKDFSETEKRQIHILRLAESVVLGKSQFSDLLEYREALPQLIKEWPLGNVDDQTVCSCLCEMDQDAFWFDLQYDNLEGLLKKSVAFPMIEMPFSNVFQFSKIIIHLLGFWSSFSAVHSCGVAATAQYISSLMPLTELENKQMRVAGYLHDLGKMAIPLDILNKVGSLDKREISVVKTHVYYTYKILQRLEELGDILQWASEHHEKRDGTGYPFRKDENSISIHGQILAVADVFTALREARPYRDEIPLEKALDILTEMAPHHLNPDIVQLVTNNSEYMDELRVAAHQEARIDTRELERALYTLDFP